MLDIISINLNDSPAYLNARNDTLGLQYVNKRSTVVGALVECLLIEYHTRDMLLQAFRGKQKLPILSSVGLSIFNT